MPTASLPYQYNVTLCSTATWYQVASLTSQDNKSKFIKYLSDLGATQYGDRYNMPSKGAMDDAIKRTKDMGGTSYGLTAD